MQPYPSEQQSYKFSALSVFSVDKKWVVCASSRQDIKSFSWQALFIDCLDCLEVR